MWINRDGTEIQDERTWTCQFMEAPRATERATESGDSKNDRLACVGELSKRPVTRPPRTVRSRLYGPERAGGAESRRNGIALKTKGVDPADIPRKMNTLSSGSCF